MRYLCHCGNGTSRIPKQTKFLTVRTDTQNTTISQVREYAFEILDKHADINRYTNINRLFRVEKNIQTILRHDRLHDLDEDALYLANYIVNIEQGQANQFNLDFSKESQFVDATVARLQEKFGLDEGVLEKARQIAIESLPTGEAQKPESKVLSDALIMDFTGDGGRERMKNLYEQIILRDFSLSKESWYDILLPLLERSDIHTEFGKAEIEPGLAKLAKSLRKERKDIEDTKSRAIERELAISEEEIKQLKKEISKAKGRDDRGIQTLFRNISRNHYTLNQMVDGKANIMITVNSIILSLILGGSMGTIQEDNLVRYIPFFLLGGVNIVSIIFAVLAITPVKTQGNFTEDEVRNKQGNLLYFGNFHNMSYRDFEWGFLQMLSDRDYLYGSMIRDYYYQAQGLERKYRLLRASLYVFFIGLSLAMVLQGVLKLIELTA